jgi:SPRY domain
LSNVLFVFCKLVSCPTGPSILRRAGAAGYAARAGWFARGLGGVNSSSARRAAAVAGIMGDELSLEDDDLWESVIHGVGEMGHDMEALAMDVGGNSARSRMVESSRQRFLEAARAFSQANRDAHQAVDPDDLLRAATANAASYQPHWANPATLAGARSPRSGNGIEVGDGVERQNLAHLPVGAGEGRAIRAEEPLPRGDSGSNAFASFRMPSATTNNDATASNQSDDSPPRRSFGFRVAFDHPTTGDVTGANMGGCYLIGVTTSSFTAYGEQNGLQQSAFFWGIEDGGQKYEGSRHSSGRTGQRRAPGAAGAAYAIDLGETEAPMNAHSVLFGAREVVTCICDLDSRTLTFWRDETLLGTLVTNLPRSGNLYPVAVPFNCGVTVAITGLDNDPLPL